MSTGELGVHGEEKVSGCWEIINKNGSSTYKSGNFNSLGVII